MKLFRFAKQARAIGEARVAYLWSRTAAHAISERIPSARIIMILRDPADRAFSRYRAALANGMESVPFGTVIRERIRHLLERFGLLSPLLEYGCYHRQVERYLETFGRDHVYICLYHEYFRDPGPELRRLFGFLGVDPAQRVNFGDRQNESRVPRLRLLALMLRAARRAQVTDFVPQALKKRLAQAVYQPRAALSLGAADRRFLIDFYRDDTVRLAELISRDLSSWLEA